MLNLPLISTPPRVTNPSPGDSLSSSWLMTFITESRDSRAGSQKSPCVCVCGVLFASTAVVCFGSFVWLIYCSIQLRMNYWDSVRKWHATAADVAASGVLQNPPTTLLPSRSHCLISRLGKANAIRSFLCVRARRNIKRKKPRAPRKVHFINASSRY